MGTREDENTNLNKPVDSENRGNPQVSDDGRIRGHVGVQAGFNIPTTGNLTVFQEQIHDGQVVSSRVSDAQKTSAIRGFDVEYHFPHNEGAKLYPYLTSGVLLYSRGADSAAGNKFTDAGTTERIRNFSLGAGVAIPDVLIDNSEIKVSGNFISNKISNSQIFYMSMGDAEANFNGVALNVQAKAPVLGDTVYAFGSASLPYLFKPTISRQSEDSSFEVNIPKMFNARLQMGLTYEPNDVVEFGLAVGMLVNTDASWKDVSETGVTYAHATSQKQGFKNNMTLGVHAKFNLGK